MTFNTVYIGNSGWFPYLSNTVLVCKLQSSNAGCYQKEEWMVEDEVCSDIDYSEYCWLSKPGRILRWWQDWGLEINSVGQCAVV